MRGLGNLFFYKMHDDVTIPIKATAESACFDFHAYLAEGTELKVEDNDLYQSNIVTSYGSVTIGPRTRMLIPTGLIAEIPKGHSIRIYPRSGLSFKHGLALSNQVGVVDSDYVEEIFISLINLSNTPKKIIHNMRIAQGELVSHQWYRVRETVEKPVSSSDRVGGFGSTGLM
jgi:dUTP pyrophosphatase